jgi:hypothetical protein
MTESIRKSPMQTYADTVDHAVPTDDSDAFAASRAAFDALTVTLGGAQTGRWTHDQVEDHLERHGRELLRLLLQDHLDLRARRERHAVRHRRLGPVTDADGISRR